MGAAEVLALAAPTGSCLVELQESARRARTGQLLPRSDDTYAHLARAMAIQREDDQPARQCKSRGRGARVLWPRGFVYLPVGYL